MSSLRFTAMTLVRPYDERPRHLPSCPSDVFFSRHGSATPSGCFITPTMLARSMLPPPRLISLLPGNENCDRLRPSPVIDSVCRLSYTYISGAGTYNRKLCVNYVHLSAERSILSGLFSDVRTYITIVVNMNLFNVG